MDIRTEDLSRFVGGQIEIQNHDEGYLYRGEIETIEIARGAEVPGVDRNDFLVVAASWMAKYRNDSWISVPDKLDYRLSLLISSAVDGGDNRIVVTGRPPFSYELVALFPKGGSRLDPAKVEGLVQTA